MKKVSKDSNTSSKVSLVITQALFKLKELVDRGKLRSPPKVYDLEFYSANLKLLALIRLLWKNTQKC